jgi:HEAT repeat protein
MATLPVLIQDLGHADRERRAACAEELARRGEPAVLPLCEVLRTGTALQRCTAADVLARIRDPRSIPPLIGLLEYPDAGVRAHAAAALGALAAPEALLPLWACVRSSPPEASVQAIRALAILGEMGTPEAVRPLAEVIHAGPSEAAVIALRGLEGWARRAPHVGLREALPVLRAKLLRIQLVRDPTFQLACASALAAVEGVTASLKDLPLPASGSRDPADLPVPAEPAKPDLEHLPLASDSPRPNTRRPPRKQ